MNIDSFDALATSSPKALQNNSTCSYLSFLVISIECSQVDESLMKLAMSFRSLMDSNRR